MNLVITQIDNGITLKTILLATPGTFPLPTLAGGLVPDGTTLIVSNGTISVVDDPRLVAYPLILG